MLSLKCLIEVNRVGDIMEKFGTVERVTIKTAEIDLEQNANTPLTTLSTTLALFCIILNYLA